jgi:hypothetical protein
MLERKPCARKDATVDYLGLFSLGAFVGAIVTYGLRFIDGFSSFAQAVTLILAAALSGTSIVFLDRFANKTPALGAYAVGLMVALMWAYAKVGVENITSENPSLRVLGWAHIVGVVIVSVAAAALVLPGAYREVWRR